MKIFHKINELKHYLHEMKKEGKSIGFVPTMGYLHEGHLSLIKEAKSENDLVIISIFVNPTQFGPNEDLDKYPRDLERDITLAGEAGGNVIFAPTAKEMYPDGFQTYVEVENVTKSLCGASRPGHFKGVTTIVNKLFHIVEPNRAYFGQKDAQQTVVVKRMVRDLNMNVEIRVCPIVREEDGLAMSSRNVYLSEEAREQATVLFQSLALARHMILEGERDARRVQEAITKKINSKPMAAIDYISLVDLDTLQDISEIKQAVLIALAVKFGNTRLIDNMIVEV